VVSVRTRRQEKQCRARDEEQRRQRQTSHDDTRRLLRRVQSDYDRRRLDADWACNLQTIYGKAAAPASHWWTHFMRVAAVRVAARRARYDTIRDAILTCAQKLPQVSLIDRMEPTTKKLKTEKKSKK